MTDKWFSTKLQGGTLLHCYENHEQTTRWSAIASWLCNQVLFSHLGSLSLKTWRSRQYFYIQTLQTQCFMTKYWYILKSHLASCHLLHLPNRTEAECLFESATIKRLSKDKPNMAPPAVMCPLSAATVGIPKVRIPRSQDSKESPRKNNTGYNNLLQNLCSQSLSNNTSSHINWLTNKMNQNASSKTGTHWYLTCASRHVTTHELLGIRLNLSGLAHIGRDVPWQQVPQLLPRVHQGDIPVVKSLPSKQLKIHAVAKETSITLIFEVSACWWWFSCKLLRQVRWIL